MSTEHITPRQYIYTKCANIYTRTRQPLILMLNTRGLSHAVIMICSFSILLSLVYTQTRPATYVHPHATIKKAIGFDSAKNIESIEDSK